MFDSSSPRATCAKGTAKVALGMGYPDWIGTPSLALFSCFSTFNFQPLTSFNVQAFKRVNVPLCRTSIPVRCLDLSPLFATLTKTAGCAPKIPNMEHSGSRPEGTHMIPVTSSSTTITDSSPLHCQHRSASGRRFFAVCPSDPDSGLCSRHAALLQKDLDQADLAAFLIGDIH